MICQPGNVPKLHLGVLICKQCGSVEQCVSINDMRKGLCYKCFREAIERASPGKPVSRAEACRIATEVTEDVERRRAETAEQEAQGLDKAYAKGLTARPSGNCPQIVCLCGSTRFTDIMQVKAWELSKAGYIIVTWGVVPEWYYSGSHIGDHEGVKATVDELHKRKIDLCDFVLVIDVEGYIGESTRSEIDYAEKHGKPVKYLSKAEPEYVENLRKKFLAANEPRGVPISLPEACRVAREVLENAEAARAETAEREAQAFHEQTPREIIEEFLKFAENYHYITLEKDGKWGSEPLTGDEYSDLLDAFENQKEKP